MKKLVISTALLLALFATAAFAQAGTAAGQAPDPSAAQQPTQGSAAPPADRGQAQDQDKANRQDKDKDDKDKDQDKSARVDDQQLERRVRDQLSSRPDFRNIQVAVKDGVVELQGSVVKKEDRAEAVDLAKSVEGVRRVREHLKIDANAASQSASASQRGEEAGEHGAAASSEAAEQSGQNTAGSVAGNTAAQAGTTAGAAQPGTTAGVTGESGATGQTAGPDAQVQSQIQQAIQNDSALASSNVKVNVVNNQILLSGSVASDNEKQQAEHIAQQHANGLQVVNDITVGAAAIGTATSASGGISGAATGAQQPPSQQPSGAAGSVGSPTQETVPRENTSDSGGMAPDQLKSQLDQALQKEPTLSSCNLSSQVTADSIELTGSCPTGKEKQTARRMAQSLAGNRRVVDRITVTGRGQGANQDKQNQNQVPPQL